MAATKTATLKMPAKKTPKQKSLAPKTKALSKPGSRTPSPAKSPGKRTPITSTDKDVGPIISAEERQRLVERAAYFRAEKRGFAPGFELQDWIEAEVEVLRLIGSP